MFMKTGKKQANMTSWKPGQSGNPKGRPPKGHSITETIRSMMDEDPQVKRKLADKVIKMALEGNVVAIRTIWQYLDGLPQQKTDITTLDKELPTPIFGGASLRTSCDNNS